MSRKLFLLFFLILPVFCLPFVYNGFELPKTILLRITVEILSGLFWVGIVVKLLDLFYGKSKKTIGFLVLIYFIWVLMTSFLCGHWSWSLMGNYFRQQGILTLFHWFLLFLIVGLASFRLDKRSLALVLVGGALLASLWAIFQAVLYLKIGNYLPRVGGSLGSPIFLGGYLAVSLPFGIFLGQKNRAYFLILPFILLGIVFSASRGALFLVLLLVFLYFGYYLKKKWLFLILAMVLALGFFLAGQEISPHESRAKIWGKGLMAFSQKPVFGWGVENFDEAFASVLDPQKDISLNDLRVDKAHNEFLEVLVASGFVGLILYLAILAAALKSLWAKAKNLKEKHWWLAVFLSLSLLVFRSQFNPLSISEQTLLWLFLGLSASPETAEEKRSKIAWQQGQMRRILNWIVWLIVIWLIIFNFRSLIGDYYFKRGIEMEKIDRSKTIGFFNLAERIFPWEEVYQIKQEEYNY